MYKFSTDWFSQNLPFWLDIRHHYKPKKILEVGSFEGRSTCWMIEHFSINNPLEIYCIDTWEGSVEHALFPELSDAIVNLEDTFVNNINYAAKLARHDVSLHMMKGKSLNELPKLIVQGINDFDLVYIDGSHIASDVLIDACLGFEMLKVGGVIVFDDYKAPNYKDDHPDDFKDMQSHPRLGYDNFIKCNANRILRINFDEEYNHLRYQEYIKKIA